MTGEAMQALGRAYHGLILTLAALAIAGIILMTVLILGDVTMRYLGLGSIQSASMLIEYSLLFSTMMAAPWLVRRRGHITITSMVDLLPPAARKIMGTLSLVVSIVTLLVLGWRSALVGLDKWRGGGMDIRSIAVPEWIAYAILSVGFLLMATECMRLMLRRELEPVGSSAT